MSRVVGCFHPSGTRHSSASRRSQTVLSAEEERYTRCFRFRISDQILLPLICCAMKLTEINNALNSEYLVMSIYIIYSRIFGHYSG